MDRRVLVKCLDAGEQVGLRQAGIVFFQHRMQPTVLTGLDLVAHIHLTGRVLTDQNHGQPRGDAFGLECVDTAGDIGTQLLRKCNPVNDAGAVGGSVHINSINKKARLSLWGGHI